jgi:hypothetical protein
MVSPVPPGQQPFGQLCAVQTQIPSTQPKPSTQAPQLPPQPSGPHAWSRSTQLTEHGAHCWFRQDWFWLQVAHCPPPSPQSENTFPGWQAPLASQQPSGHVCALQHGAAQKLPEVGQVDPAGAASTQKKPGPKKSWHWVSLVQPVRFVGVPQKG